ncbi:MAG: zinc-binding dehydrogenase [Candidatus Bathyarchaeota archaeon]|nr:zinc-binding dehydrogenase [Candidatus Bathyarchaeota archaeon]
MRAILCDGPESIVVKDIEEPKININESFVEPLYGSICGSDVAIAQFHGKRYPGIEPTKTNPVILGHEWSGLANDKLVSSGCTLGCYSLGVYPPCPSCSIGRDDQCHNRQRIGFELPGAFREKMPFPAVLVYELPKNLSAKDASQTEPLSVSINAVSMLGEIDGEKDVLIYGSGAVGLYALQYAKVMGARSVFAVDIADFRLDFAKRLGAERIINPNKEDVVQAVMEATEGKGVEVALECTGYPPAFAQALKATTKMGTVVILSIYGSELKIEEPFKDMTNKGLTIKNARLGPCNSVRKAISCLSEKSVKPVITHEFDIGEASKAFEVAANPSEHKAIKVVIKIK